MGLNQGKYFADKLDEFGLHNLPNEIRSLYTEDNMTDYGENNGLFLKDIYFPPEIVTLILSYVDVKTLGCSCTRVCSMWNTLIKEEVWKMKAERKYNRKLKRYPHLTYQMMCVKDPFNRNLLMNPCGMEGFSSWTITMQGGDKFTIEKEPVYCDPIPQELRDAGYTSCFATSFDSCRKMQRVDLVKAGLRGDFLDEYQPPIYVSEWFGSRNDCGSKYSIKVTLVGKRRDKKRDVVIGQPFVADYLTEQWQGGQWTKVEHTFTNYGPGVRYVIFDHMGQDRQFWKGHYGSKMTGATVKILDTF